MKKVIILNHGLHISGVSRVLVNFANSLVEHGYDVTIKIEIDDFTLKSELDDRVKCSLFLKEPHPFGLRIKGFLRYYAFWRERLLKKSAKAQYKAVVKENYDVEIAFNRGAAAKIISGSTNKNAVKLAWVHNDYMRNDNPLAGFNNLDEAVAGYKKFDKVVCVSEQAEKSFIEKFGDTNNTVTCYNIMDFDAIRNLSKEKSITKTKFTAVAVGRLADAKNYSMMLDAVAILNKRGVVFELWIVGDGPMKNELFEKKISLKLDNVIFHGAQVNPYPYFGGADLYVSSSTYEGLSTTTIEALVLGKPCVVTDCTGMKNILGENNEYGIIVPIEAMALADAIEKMINNEKLCQQYSDKARERADYFNPEKTFSKIEALFKQHSN